MTLKVGDAAPDFKLPAVTGETQGEFQLSSQKGRNVVLLFYVLDFTPVCAAELPPFQADLAKLAGVNAVVAGICTDTIFSHIAFQKSLGGLAFPLASDRWPYAETAKAYGLFPATKHQFGGMNDRAVFIVDKAGKIAWTKVYDIGEAPKVHDILDELKKLV
ncbi:MAG TPA: redoxin domain-containing protein [Terriglobia bacterium]|nr:redoxin domain-containing protein [Terriglobia bacterium]